MLNDPTPRLKGRHVPMNEWSKKDFVVCVAYDCSAGREIFRSEPTTRAKAYRDVNRYHVFGHQTWIEDPVGGIVWEPKVSNHWLKIR